MRLLVVTSSYPRHRRGLAGRFVWEMNRHLVERGHEIEVATWRARGGGDVGDERPPRGGGVVRRVPYAPGPLETLFDGSGILSNLERQPLRALELPVAFAAMVRHLRERIRAWKPDLLVAHWLVPGGLVAQLASAGMEVRSMTIAHSGGVHVVERLPGAVRRAVGTLFRGTRLVATTGAVSEKLRRICSSVQPTVRPMGYPPRVEAPPDSPLGRDVLFMGRLVPIKGPELALRGFREAFAREDREVRGESRGRDGVTFHIAGEGPMASQLRSEVGAGPGKGSDRRDVEFHGTVVGEQKVRLLRRCMCSVFPSRRAGSRHEGLPVSFLEASAAGAVPLVGEIPGIRRYLAEPALQHVESREPSRWAKRMRQIADLGRSRRMRLIAETRRRVEALSWPALICDWERELERTADPSTGG